MKIILQNFRSLCGPHQVSLKPLTVLVGENSSGKSTFLASLAHLYSLKFPQFRPSFNVPPFDLGTYDSIATYKGGKFGRAKFFSLGFEVGQGNRKILVRATYVNSEGQPQLSRFRAKQGATELRFEADTPSRNGKITLMAPGLSPITVAAESRYMNLRESTFPLSILIDRIILAKKNKLRPKVLQALDHIMSSIYHLRNFSPALALAPVRTKPRRTYDPVSDEFKPEGDHIPVILARLWDQPEEPQSKSTISSLKRFGRDSSLFEDIEVRRLGKRPNDPFQVLVNIAGPAANLLDVGYGVSQSLPIIVDSSLSAKDRLVLLQQPEIHLHPRGQAALGSFLVHAVAKQKKSIVVETHSDYLLDRIRYEVAQRNIEFKDVLILFFEKQNIETTIHEIKLDSGGNILDAPSSYRRFFLEEDTRVLFRTKRR